MKKLVLAIMAMACCTLSFAKTGTAASFGNQAEKTQAQKYATQSAFEIAPATSICSFTFTTGKDLTFLKYCVTANGNITQLETPERVEHIAAGDVEEGYGVCDLTDENNNIAYFDYADGGDSRNWGPATVLSQTAKSIKMARTTGDGVWTLTQTFTLMPGNAPSVQIRTTPQWTGAWA